MIGIYTYIYIYLHDLYIYIYIFACFIYISIFTWSPTGIRPGLVYGSFIRSRVLIWARLTIDRLLMYVFT